MVSLLQNKKSFNIVYFYAHDSEKDKNLVDEFTKQMSILEHIGKITLWNKDRNITGGLNINDQTFTHIDNADIIFFFVSADFLNEYMNSNDADIQAYIQRVMERQKSQKVRVIPVILRSCDWQDTSFASLQPFPRDGKSIGKDRVHQDEVWASVVEEVKNIFAEEDLRRLAPSTKDFSIDELIPQKNRYFIGRETLLETLYSKLAPENIGSNRMVAIVGLGGVGKTQLAIEYMWRYHDKYKFVLWAKADTPDTLVSELFKLIRKLSNKFMDNDEQNPSIMTHSVKQWLEENPNWLLVLDNVHLDETDLVEANAMAGILEELPHNGHILITTRSQSRLMKALADPVQVDNMSEDEAKKLLLLRAGLLTREQIEQGAFVNFPYAQELAINLLGCLPLALEQAAAYIHQEKFGLDGYIQRYQEEGERLRAFLVEQEQEPNRDTIATTWSISFKAVEKTNKTAAELLKALSFLAAGAIPEEIILEGSSELGTILGAISSKVDLDDAVKTLEDYSLLQSNKTTHLLIIHRLVQEVLKDNLVPRDNSSDYEARRNKIKAIWAERVVRAVNRVFPDGSIATWEGCQGCEEKQQVCSMKNLCSNKRLALSQRCLLHAQVCARYIKDYGFSFSEAAELLYHTASYLHSYDALYDIANSYYNDALQIQQVLSKKITLDTAASHNDLARLYRDQYKYDSAMSHFEEAIRIRKQQLGSRDRQTAHSIASLARLYMIQGNYDKAEELFTSALKTHKKNQSKHPTKEADREVAKSSYGLAQLYHKKGQYVKAKELYEEVLNMDTELFGDHHPLTAQCLDSLGNLYRDLEDLNQAENFIQQSLDIREAELEKNQKPKHPDTAQSLNDLGDLYRIRKRYEEAEKLINEALEIRRTVLNSPDAPNFDRHPDIAQSYNSLGSLYNNWGRYGEAEDCYNKALEINRRILGEMHPHTAYTLSSLADLYFNEADQATSDKQAFYAKAKQFAERAYEIRKKLHGPTPADMGHSLYNMARLAYANSDYQKAEEYYKATLDLDEKELGSGDRRTIMVRRRYINLLRQMNRAEEADKQEALLTQHDRSYAL